MAVCWPWLWRSLSPARRAPPGWQEDQQLATPGLHGAAGRRLDQGHQSPGMLRSAATSRSTDRLGPAPAGGPDQAAGLTPSELAQAGEEISRRIREKSQRHGFRPAGRLVDRFHETDRIGRVVSQSTDLILRSRAKHGVSKDGCWHDLACGRSSRRAQGRAPQDEVDDINTAGGRPGESPPRFRNFCTRLPCTSAE